MIADRKMLVQPAATPAKRLWTYAELVAEIPESK
jgi:hypothetical protein